MSAVRRRPIHAPPSNLPPARLVLDGHVVRVEAIEKGGRRALTHLNPVRRRSAAAARILLEAGISEVRAITLGNVGTGERAVVATVINRFGEDEFLFIELLEDPPRYPDRYLTAALCMAIRISLGEEQP